jgi:hydrogenase maturation protease
MSARVIGLGQRAAGDDGAGLVVLEALRAQGLPEGIELHEAAEATAIVPLLETKGRVILVDALLGAEPGAVLTLSPEQLEEGGLSPLSTHGVSVAQAIALARMLSPEVSPEIRLVGIGVRRPERYSHELSPEVLRAIPRAVDAVLALLGG